MDISVTPHQVTIQQHRENSESVASVLAITLRDAELAAEETNEGMKRILALTELTNERTGAWRIAERCTPTR
jgi:hypothetical protein